MYGLAGGSTVMATNHDGHKNTHDGHKYVFGSRYERKFAVNLAIS